jgi:hypothetical protein
MDGVGTRFTGGRDQALNREIALGRRSGADGDGLIRRAHVGAPTVGRGINGDRLEALLMTRTDDTESDLAAVGDQDASHRTEKAERTETTETTERTRAGDAVAGNNLLIPSIARDLPCRFPEPAG